MANFKKGSAVRKVVPDIVGTVVDARLDANLEMEYLVEYVGTDGERQQRWFGAAELQAEPLPDQK